MLKHLAILVPLIGICCAQSIPALTDFSEQFVNHSCTVQPKLHGLNKQNAHVRLELIHWIIAEIGNLTVEMRRITNDSWTRIERNEMLQDPDCYYRMRYLRDYYVAVGELDIMRCAYDMSYYMWHDSVYRFVPRAQFMMRENSQAIHQTLQVLGRRNFVENRDQLKCELKDELKTQRNLWSSYRDLLGVEIEFIKPLERLVRDEMAWWFNYAISWHSLFMGLLEGSVIYYCGEGPWW